MNTIMTAMQCDAIIHEFSEKATRVKEINSFLCLLKNGIFHLSVFDTHAATCFGDCNFQKKAIKNKDLNFKDCKVSIIHENIDPYPNPTLTLT